MLETLATGLILAAVSGVTYLAYKHPPAYRKIYFPTMLLFNLFGVAIASWALGVNSSYFMVKSYIDPSKLAQAESDINRLLPRWWLMFAIFFAVNFYAQFLFHLPKLLRGQNAKSQSKLSSKSKEENT